MTGSDVMPEARSALPFTARLSRLYFGRFAFAVVWAALLIPNATHKGALLTVLLVLYPLFDAAAVLWQLRAGTRTPGPRVAERVNVAVSFLVAIALGVASTTSIAAALGVWGVWAAASGLAQLVAAISRRASGGQVPQILSGAISTVAGASFLAQAAKSATTMSAVGGYAILGGVFFLISAIRLATLVRRQASAS